MIDDALGLKALVARLSCPTCPVCWPGVQISLDLATTHREWHALRLDWMMAHAAANRTGLPTDMAELDRARFALAEFEVDHPGLT